jgi:hypothetical protein
MAAFLFISGVILSPGFSRAKDLAWSGMALQIRAA